MRLPRLFRTSSFAVALVYLACFGLSVVALLLFVFFTTTRFLDREADAAIRAETRELAEAYRRHGLEGLRRAIADAATRAGSNGIYLLTDAGYGNVAGNLSEWPEDEIVQRDGAWITFPLEQRGSGSSRLTRARAYTVELPDGHHLLVGRNLSERVKFARLIRSTLGWALLLTLGLGIAGAVVVSRNLLGRVDSINRISRRIMEGDLAQRIPLAGTDDEFDQLASNLNAMLDRIESLLRGLRQVTDDVAHDLRSPLTRLRSRLEFALAAVENPGERRVLEDAIADVDRLLATFNALLSIAQAEAGAPRSLMEEVDLGVLARDVAELYEPAAEEAGLAFSTRIEPGLVIVGNRHLLSQALANLLDNAVKYTPAGGEVRVEATRGRDGPEVTVADSGPGIPPEARGRVLERFVRLETSRNTAGSGLGLSLVSAAARLHGARLVLEDNRPGLRVTLAFNSERAAESREADVAEAAIAAQQHA